MPAAMVGCQATRVAQADALNGRAVAVRAKTRNLVLLEVDDAFLRWQEANERLEPLAKGLAKAESALKRALAEFEGRVANPDLTTTLQEVLAIRDRYVHLRLQLIQARYQRLLALADLERATAGGLCPGFDRPARTP
jgi:outer membrane protein TolC